MTTKTNLTQLRFLQDKNNAKAFLEALLQRPIPEIDCFCLSENLPDTLFEPPCLKPDIFIEDRAKNRYVIVELRDSVQYRYMDLDLELQHLQSTLETDYDDHDGTCSHYPDSYIIYIFHFEPFDLFPGGNAFCDGADIFDWVKGADWRHMIFVNTHFQVLNGDSKIAAFLNCLRDDADKLREQENLVNMWDEAQCEEDREIFVKECLESPEQTGEYMTGIREESDELCERAEARGRVWDVAHMTIKEIREAAGLSQAMLSRRLAIPQSTIRAWEAGEECPEYVRFMVALLTGVITISS